MPRLMRIEYPGAIYHVLSRGDRKKAIFLDDVDRQDFLKTLAEACQKTGFEVHASCLMKNHFHLVVETPQTNLVAGMGGLLSAYTIGLTPELRRLGWRESDLKQRPKGDAGKNGPAMRLRQERTWPIEPLAQRLHMGHRNTLRNRLYEPNKTNTSKG